MTPTRGQPEIQNQETPPSPGSEATYLCLLALIIFLGNLPLLFGKTYQDLLVFSGDFQIGVIYSFNKLGDSLRSGRFLLWGSGMGCGEPELAFYLSAYLYPLSMLFSLLSFPSRVVAYSIAHFELIGIFSFLVFRRAGISRPGSLLVAGWNAMSGYSTWISPIYVSISALPWFYLIVYLMMAPDQLRRAKNFLLLVIAMTMMLLSGDPELITYAAYFGGLWLVCFWIFNRSKLSAKTFWLVVLGFAAALALSLDQIFPAVNYLSRTVRSGKLSYQLYLSSYFDPGFLLHSLLGFFSRKYVNLYFSLLALGFCAWGVFSREKLRVRGPSLIVLFVVVLLLLLPGLGLGQVAYHIPLYSRFVRHYKMLFIIQFLVLVLAGLGVDQFLAALTRSTRALNAPLLFLGALSLIGFAATGCDPLLLLPLPLVLVMAVSRRMRFKPALVLSLLLVVDVYAYLWRPPYKFFEFKMPSYWPVFEKIAKDSEGKNRIQVFFPSLRLLAREDNPRIPRLVTGMPGGQGFDFWMSFPLVDYARLLALINPEIEKPVSNIGDIFNFHAPFTSRDYLTPENRHLLNMLGLRWLFLDGFSLKETELRSVVFDPDYFLNPALKNGFEGYRAGESEINGQKQAWIHSSVPARFFYQSDFSAGDEVEFRLGSEKDPAWFMLKAEVQDHSRIVFARWQNPTNSYHPYSLKVPDATKGIEFLLLKEGCRPAGWIDPQIRNRSKTIKYVTGGQVRLFENTEALPRGWIVHEAIIFNSREELAKTLVDNRAFKPDKTVLIFDPGVEKTFSEHIFPDPGPCGPAGEKVELKEYSREFIRLSVRTCSPGFLVWTDQYYPGWQAFVNGKEQKTLRADLCFRSIRLGSGDHDIIFRFNPPDFRTGLYSSLAGWLVLVFAGLAVAFQRTRSNS